MGQLSSEAACPRPVLIRSWSDTMMAIMRPPIITVAIPGTHPCPVEYLVLALRGIDSWPSGCRSVTLVTGVSSPVLCCAVATHVINQYP